MSVRSTVKAIILNDGKVLLNRCNDPNNGNYYSLPGGGQQQYETLEEAILRECLEETGYTVAPVRFAALFEEICDDPFVQKKYAVYAHKMLHIFICKLASDVVIEPTETDSLQISSEWIDIKKINEINLLPKVVKKHFICLLSNDCPMFLGSEHITHNHG